MGIMFMSYRRSDSATVSGHIYDHLVRIFGKGAVFKDVYAIPAGVNFAQYIDTHVRKCSVLLAIIGRDWLTATDPNGAKRLDDPEDFVRLEIESALKRRKPIIPLLVGGATMPPAHLLPPTLRNLTLQNAVQIRSQPDFENDMARLSLALTQWSRPSAPLTSLSNTSVGHPAVRVGLSFGLVIGVLSFMVAGSATILGNQNQSRLYLLGALFTGFLFLCYFFAGTLAARRTGLTSTGTAAGLLAGIFGAVVGGPIYGSIIGASSNLTDSPSGLVMLELGGLCIGALLLPAFTVGAALGAVGGRLGSRRYLSTLSRR
jgi:TIR domain